MPRRPRLALIAALGALALLAGLPTAATEPSSTAYLGSYTWRMSERAFGGISGLEVDADGSGFVAISDRGSIISGHLTRDASGAVSGVTGAHLTALRDAGGAPVRGRRGDAEGLAIGADGRLFVSFEGNHRVVSYARPGGSATDLPRHAEFRSFGFNSGLEALAIDAAGRLYAVPERSGALDRPFPVYRWTGSAWEQPFTLPRNGNFLPTGADFGPDGKLYLVERDFRGWFGFRSRISRFEIGTDGPGAQEILVETTTPRYDNLEGIAVWRDRTGALRLTLISDDNFSPLQRTQFVDYRLAD